MARGGRLLLLEKRFLRSAVLPAGGALRGGRSRRPSPCGPRGALAVALPVLARPSAAATSSGDGGVAFLAGREPGADGHGYRAVGGEGRAPIVVTVDCKGCFSGRAAQRAARAPGWSKRSASGRQHGARGRLREKWNNGRPRDLTARPGEPPRIGYAGRNPRRRTGTYAQHYYTTNATTRSSLPPAVLGLLAPPLPKNRNTSPTTPAPHQKTPRPRP